MATKQFQIYCDGSNDGTSAGLKAVAGDNNITKTTAFTTSTTAPLSTITTTTTSHNLHHKDEGQQQLLQQLQNVKREPLGLRQPQQVLTTLQSSQQATTSASSHDQDEEDQENDISMASLGSDYVPSIYNDQSSLELDDEEEDEEANATFDDTDEEMDEDLERELNEAFKQQDEAQLFKSAVYIDDIDRYLKELERVPDLRPLPNYMDFQNDIDSDKRAILVNWLIEVSDEYDLQTETLFITTGIIDRFLSEMALPTSNFQLLGVAAMFIASKYEEIYPPNLSQFVEVTDYTYTGQQICQMEQEILKTLNFRISVPTTIYFLRQIFAFNKFPKKVFHLAEYLCHLSLGSDDPILEYLPSEIALAAVILAAHQLDAAANITKELQLNYEQSNFDQLQRRELPKGSKLSNVNRKQYIINKELPFCIESLRTLQETHYKNKSSFVYQKFSSESHNSVALLTPLKLDDLVGIHQ